MAIFHLQQITTRSLAILALLFTASLLESPLQFAAATPIQENHLQGEDGEMKKIKLQGTNILVSQIGEKVDFIDRNHHRSRGSVTNQKDTPVNYKEEPLSRSLAEGDHPLSSISQIGEEIIGDGIEDLFGMSTDISGDGNFFIVGAPGKNNNTNDNDTGYAKVYKRNNSNSSDVPQWIQVGQTIHGDGDNDFAGIEVAMNGGTGKIIAVSSKLNVKPDKKSGQVQVFEFNETSSRWDPLGAALNGTQNYERFGETTALSDDGHTIAIGSFKYDYNDIENIGKVEIYEWDGSAWTQVGSMIIGETEGDQFGHSVALSGNGDIVVIGAPFNNRDENTNESGHVRVYQRDSTSITEQPIGWVQVGQDIDGAWNLDRSGFSVACSSDGSTIVIGAIQGNSGGKNTGTVRAYVRNETDPMGWTQKGQVIAGDDDGDKAGVTVSSSSDGRIIVIGAKNHDVNDTENKAGHAKVFAYNDCEDKYEQIGEDIAGEARGDQAGYDASISGDGRTVVVGARLNDSSNGLSSGHVRIYNVVNIPLHEISNVPEIGDDIVTDGADDLLGISTAISWDGNFFVVGAPGRNESSSGYTKVYEKKVTPFKIEWLQKGQTIHGDTMDDRSGLQVAMDKYGKIIAIASRLNDQQTLTGQVRILEFNENSQLWIQLGAALDGTKQGQKFGSSIALSDDGHTIAIASRKYNTGGKKNIGKVEVHKWNGTAWDQVGSDIIGEAEQDQSGYSVALSGTGEVVVIGAIYNDPSQEKINAGHVRVYKLDPHIDQDWVKVGEDIDGEAPGDLSGYSVACSSDCDTIVIGANMNDGQGLNSGHARVYVRNEGDPVGWTQKGKDIDGEYKNDQSGITASLSADGKFVIIGAKFNSGGGTKSGHARIYVYDDNKWIKVGCDIDGEAQGDQAGYDSSISGDGKTVLVGARLNDGFGHNSGQVRVFFLGDIASDFFAAGGGGKNDVEIMCPEMVFLP